MGDRTGGVTQDRAGHPSPLALPLPTPTPTHTTTMSFSDYYSLLTWTTLLASLVYAWLLSKRLDSSRYARPASSPFPSDEELLASSEDWRDIDVLEGTEVDTATTRRYLITGSNGNFGPHLTKLLHQRGERSIFLLDIVPPAPSIAALKGITYIHCNITSYESVRAAFEQAQPDVVFHVCAAIRFWERASFTLPYSWGVNVDGTKHVIRALQDLSVATPGSEERLLVYSSSAAVVLPPPLHMRLGRNFNKASGSGYPADFVLSDEREMPEQDAARHCYAVSKAEADRLVRKAHGKRGIRTGVIRPGMTVCSPTDLVTGSTLRQKINPVFVGSYAQNFINSQDMAVFLLLLEKALQERPDQVGGEAFLVTGDRDLWTFEEIRKAVQVFTPRDLRYTAVPALPLYILAHILEAYCYVRYHLCLPLSLALHGRAPNPHPKWMESSRLFQLQPAMWNTATMDVGIDDSRARKVLGYRNKFSNAQTLRWIVDTVEESMAMVQSKSAVPAKDDNVLNTIGIALPDACGTADNRAGTWPVLGDAGAAQ